MTFKYFSKYLPFWLYTIFYFFTLILFRHFIIDILNTGHADAYYYYDEVQKIITGHRDGYYYNLESKNFVKLFINIFNYSSFEQLHNRSFRQHVNINVPLITFYSLLLTIKNSIYTILIFNSILYVILFFQLNKTLSKLNFSQINFFEFLIFSLFLSYFNIGINKEIIFTLLLIKLFYFCLILRSENTNFFLLFLKLTFFFILISFVKPFHAFIIIFPLSLFLLLTFISKKKFIYLFAIFFLFVVLVFKIFPIITNFHNIRVFENVFNLSNLIEFIYFNISNIIDFINYNRENNIKVGLSNFNLSYLNHENSRLINDIFSFQNFKVLLKSFLSSLFYPNFFDITFAFREKARFTLFIITESLLVKLGILYLIYLIFKTHEKLYISIIFFLIFISVVISVNIPNDGIGYRYIYPYKFILIFIGYLNLKSFFLKRYW